MANFANGARNRPAPTRSQAISGADAATIRIAILDKYHDETYADSLLNEKIKVKVLLYYDFEWETFLDPRNREDL